jgi:hypothetical protein
MRTSSSRQKSPAKSTSSGDNAKAPITPMTDDRRREVIAQLTDDVLSKLTGAFFDVCKFERWSKRDLSSISGINETAIGHILAGRRKNLTVETIAVLSRAMHVRPELVLHDTRPSDNLQPQPKSAIERSFVLGAAIEQKRSALASVFETPGHAAQQSTELQKVVNSAEDAAYAPAAFAVEHT